MESPFNDILSLEQIERGLKDKRLYAVSRETNISYPTLQKLQKGVIGNYTLHTLFAVSEYIRSTQIDKEDTFQYNQED